MHSSSHAGPNAPTAAAPPTAEAPAARLTHEQAAALREARFGALPERIALADTVEEKQALPANQATDAYDSDSLGVRFSCLAADWGL